MSIKSTYPDIKTPELSFTDYVFEKNKDNENIAFVDGPSGREVTYKQLYGQIKMVAGSLKEKGFGPGKVLAIIAPNLPEFAVVFHGVAFAGGCVTTVNPTYKAEEMKHQLVNSGAVMAVTIGMFLETVKEASQGTSVNEIFTFDSAEGSSSIAELFKGPALEKQVEVPLADHVVALPYSSGTTGRSKGVMLTHKNLVSNCEQIFASGVTFPEGTSFVTFLPFFHIYSMVVLMNCGLRSNTKQVTMPRFDLVKFLEHNQKHKCQWMFLVPPIIIALAKHPIVDKYDLSATEVIFSGAAPLGGEVADACAARLGCECRQGYGMTELSPVSHLFPPGGLKKEGSIGLSVASTESRVVGEDGKDVARGERGELWIRGPQVMKGYLNNEEATKHTIDDDGWLHTGDVAIVDEDDYFFIVDRLKELIKVKGFQCAPAELEALLLTNEKIADCAVIGVPDDESGELPKAFVVKKPDVELSEDDVKAFIKGKVATYKQLAFVEFVDSIPKSASGKILRRMLRDAEKAKVAK